MKITRECDNNCNEITTITVNSKERIVICASLKHYLDLVRNYFTEKDIKMITDMIDALE